MKKSVLSLLFLGVALIGFNSVALSQPESKELVSGPVITMDKDIHDYGTIDYNSDGTCVFVVTNTGNAPLIISNAKGTCGCTVPTWPKTPIAPGASAEISVKYKTTNVGPINKKVYITSNAVNAPKKEVKIAGKVKPKPVTNSPVSSPGPVTP